MNESVERAVLERRIKALEEESRINRDFRAYVMKLFEERVREREAALNSQKLNAQRNENDRG